MAEKVDGWQEELLKFSEDQCLKWRMPVNTMAMLCSSAA
jgi:hypothetical protein